MTDIIQLPNASIGKFILPRDIHQSVMSEVKEIERCGSSNTYNQELAGAIEKEYVLIKSRSSLDPFIIDIAAEYMASHHFRYHQHARTGDINYEDHVNLKKELIPKYQVESIWVNFQEKNEYNPIHNHSGDLSFVIWMEIPFKISDERKVKNVVNSNNSKSAAAFEFVYTDILGKINTFTFPVEKGWEGRILIFPAQLHHTVYPFQTSDGYRISISGNVSSTISPDDILQIKEL